MDLPTPIDAFFRNDAGTDPDPIAQAFAADAVVEDEGARHLGRAAIRAWWIAAKAKYRHVATPVAAEREGDRLRVTASVRGDFPGSPARIGFLFTQDGDAISHLRIG